MGENFPPNDFIASCPSAQNMHLTDIPQRLQISGEKTVDGCWHDVNVPIADWLYDQHPEQLRREGAMDG